MKNEIGIEPEVFAIDSPDPNSKGFADSSDCWVDRRGRERDDELDELLREFWWHEAGCAPLSASTTFAFEGSGRQCACRNPITS